MCEIYPNLTTKTKKRRQSCSGAFIIKTLIDFTDCSGVSNVDFQKVNIDWENKKIMYNVQFATVIYDQKTFSKCDLDKPSIYRCGRNNCDIFTLLHLTNEMSFKVHIMERSIKQTSGLIVTELMWFIFWHIRNAEINI